MIYINQELVERILFGTLEEKIKSFSENQQYLAIVSKIKTQMEKLLSIDKEEIKNFWKAIITRRFGEIRKNKEHWIKFKEYLDAIYNLSEQIKKFNKKRNEW